MKVYKITDIDSQFYTVTFTDEEDILLQKMQHTYTTLLAMTMPLLEYWRANNLGYSTAWYATIGMLPLDQYLLSVKLPVLLSDVEELTCNISASLSEPIPTAEEYERYFINHMSKPSGHSIMRQLVLWKKQNRATYSRIYRAAAGNRDTLIRLFLTVYDIDALALYTQNVNTFDTVSAYFTKISDMEHVLHALEQAFFQLADPATRQLRYVATLQTLTDDVLLQCIQPHITCHVAAPHELPWSLKNVRTVLRGEYCGEETNTLKCVSYWDRNTPSSIFHNRCCAPEENERLYQAFKIECYQREKHRTEKLLSLAQQEYMSVHEHLHAFDTSAILPLAHQALDLWKSIPFGSDVWWRYGHRGSWADYSLPHDNDIGSCCRCLLHEEETIQTFGRPLPVTLEQVQGWIELLGRSIQMNPETPYMCSIVDLLSVLHAWEKLALDLVQREKRVKHAQIGLDCAQQRDNDAARMV